MRYIRTEDGIYELQESIGVKYLVGNSRLIPLWNTGAYEIVKEGDDVGSLCDKFIGVEEDGTPHIFAYECDLSDMIRNTERKLGAKVTGYGAIWTTGKDGEPILKSAAKLNEEGVLKLL